MHKCHFTKGLSSFLDNQLPANEQLHLENHIRECSVCSEELSRLKQLSEQLKKWQAPGLGLSFDEAVKQKIVLQELEKGEPKMKRKTLAILIPSGALAGILVIAFLGILFRPGHIMQINEDMLRRGASYKAHQEIYRTDFDRAPQVSYAHKSGYALSKTAGMQNSWSVNDVDSVDLSVVTPHNKQTLGLGVVNMAGGVRSQLALQDAEHAPEIYQDAVYGNGPVIVVQPTLPATGEGDKIIRTADIALEVEDGNSTYKKAAQICQELGGYLATSRFYKDADGRDSGTIVMRIPKDKFLICLDKLGALGKIINSSTNSQDVAQEYANLKAQLDAAMVVYNKMLEALQKRQVNIPDAVRLESELTPVLQRVQNLKNQIEALNNAVSFTTIAFNFREPAVSAKVLKNSGRYIKQSLFVAAINAIKVTARALPAVIVIVVLASVLALAAFALKNLIIRLFKRE